MQTGLNVKVFGTQRTKSKPYKLKYTCLYFLMIAYKDQQSMAQTMKLKAINYLANLTQIMLIITK